jgi:hypothetical protein
MIARTADITRVWLVLVVMVQRMEYITPAVPPVMLWETTFPEAVALPLIILEGEASVPEYTVAVQVCVLIVSAVVMREVKSKV